MSKKINVLIVDDSDVIRELLTYIITSETDMHIAGTAKNGKEAVFLARLKKPDIITMDIEMPVMSGYEATTEIMKSTPVPIVIVTSSYGKKDSKKTFSAIESGALGVVNKPVGLTSPYFEESKKEFLRVLRTLAEVKVVKNRFIKKSIDPVQPSKITRTKSNIKYKMVAIGVSSGGPQVLSELLPRIPAGFNLPVVIVQHISDGFLEGMLSWLGPNCNLPLQVAKEGERLQPGNIYFCPSDRNINIDEKQVVRLKSEVDYPVTPSVSYFFNSVLNSQQEKVIAILLSGMGRDGVDEMLKLKEAGAMTIVQDETSSIVWGMPGEAFHVNAHKYVLSPREIAKKIVALSNDNIPESHS